MIYFDNAATTGNKPQTVIAAVDNALKNYSANPGRSSHLISQNAVELMFKARNVCSELFGANGENSVIFTPNCTFALNCVMKGILNPKDHVIISSLEHNSVYRPIWKMSRENEVELDIAEVVFGDSDATYRSFARLIKDNTKLIVCTHASNVTGEILPIEKIGKLCRDKGILFCVDAAQSAGVLDIDCKKMGIDYLCVAPHKGLYAPMGTGLLIANSPINKTLVEGGTGSDSKNPYQNTELPEGFESGTVNLPGIAGILAGTEFVKQKGIANIYNYEISIIQRLYQMLRSLKNVITYTDYPSNYQYAPLLSFNIVGADSEAVARYLNENGIAVRAGMHCALLAHTRLGTVDTGTVRISTSVFNKTDDADKLYYALKKL